MILVIEDDLVTCQIVSALLARLRLVCCEAHTGADAMRVLRTQPVGMVIADMMLPDTNGLHLLAEKHALPYVRDVPVICCTAQADIDTVEAALGYGAVDFVRKPIVVQSFAARVLRAMERAPVRWEPAREVVRRVGFDADPVQSLLAEAQEALQALDHSLDHALAASGSGAEVAPLSTLVARARAASVAAGAVRTVQQLDRLWRGDGTPEDIAYLRAALVIERAAFDDRVRELRGGDLAPLGETMPVR